MTTDLETLRADALATGAVLLDTAWWGLSDADEKMTMAARMDGGKFAVECTLDGVGNIEIALLCITAGGRRKPLEWPKGCSTASGQWRVTKALEVPASKS